MIHRNIRQTLVYLISLTVLLPMLIMSIAIFISIQQGINNTVIYRNQVLTKSIALSVEQQISDASTLLTSITASLDSLEGSENKKKLEVSLLNSGIYESIYVIDENGKVQYALPKNDSYTGFDFSRQSFIQEALKRTSPMPVYSPVFISTQTKNPTVGVAVRQPIGVFAAYLNLAWLSRLSNALSNEHLTSLSIVDRNGTTIANSNKTFVEEQYSIAHTELFSWARREREGTLRHIFNNDELISSVSYISGPDWYVFVSEAAESAFKATRDVLVIGLIASIAALLVAALIGYTLGRRILVSVDLLTEETRQIQAGVYRSVQHKSTYTEINRLIETFNTMSDEVHTREAQYEETNRQLQQALKQKDILLREIHHRVKNNMQIVSSLLTLQSDELVSQEDLELFENSKLRIQSMAMVHEKIYQSDGVESLPLKEYIQDLVELILYNNQTFMEYSVLGDEVTINLTQAIPCALSVFEACMNAIKYGADEDGHVQLAITIEKAADQVCIVVKDSGPGFPDNFNADTSRSMGFTLMKGLMDQLKGQLRWYNARGAVVEFSFPLAENE